MSGDRYSFTRSFIECYKSNTILWDRSHPDYVSIFKKEQCYNKLLEIWEKYNGFGTLDDVKKAINNLRGRYRIELRKIYLAEEVGRVYVPSAKIFKMLDFLRDNIKIDREKENVTAKERVFINTLPTINEYTEPDLTELSPDLSTRDSCFTRCIDQRSFTTDFIECFGKYPCLWDTSDSKYRCFLSRKKAYNDLLLVIRKHCGEECNLYDVKRKINSIRTSYGREILRVRRNPSYKTKVWWFGLAKFLDVRYCKDNAQSHDEDSIDCASNRDDAKRIIYDSANEERDADSPYNFEGNIIEMADDPFEDEEALPKQQKKNSNDIYISENNPLQSNKLSERRLVRFSAEDKLLLNAYENLQRKDTFDDLSKIWADKLRSMTDVQKLYATKAINEIIFQAELQNLTFEIVQKISALSLEAQKHNTS